MSCILHIETSTSACSVAVSEDGQNVFNKEDLNGPSHAALLGVFIDEALSFADSHAMPIDAVWVAEKFQSNSDIAGSLRNSFRASLVKDYWR